MAQAPTALRARALEATSSEVFDAELRALSAATTAAHATLARITWRVAPPRREPRRFLPPPSCAPSPA